MSAAVAVTLVLAGVTAGIAIVGVVYVVTAWMRKRCDNNTNQRRNEYTDHEVRLRIIEDRLGINCPDKKSSCSLARAEEA